MNIKKTKNGKNFWITLIVLAGFVYLSSFSLISFENEVAINETPGPELWEGYKSWTKVTKEPNTGDPTGFLDGKHKGVNAYRDVFVNDVGKEAYENQKFPLPEGTVIVKEAYKDKATWEAQSKPELTIMVKLADGSNPDTGNWEWYMGGTGKKVGRGMDTKWGKFCASCHLYGQQADYTFMSTLGK